MKRFYTATGIFFAIQAVHYIMLMPLVMYDPNKTERGVILSLTIAGLAGLYAFWRSRKKEKLHGNVIKILLAVQWLWLLGLMWATFEYPWVYETEPRWNNMPETVTLIHPAIRFSFNLLLIFPFLKYITEKQFFNKWIDRALWHLPFIIYMAYVLSLLFEQRPVFIG